MKTINVRKFMDKLQKELAEERRGHMDYVPTEQIKAGPKDSGAESRS
jgi:hypothetical protein